VHVLVKELEHDIDGILERGGGVYEAEKGTGPAGREIADFESQKGFAFDISERGWPDAVWSGASLFWELCVGWDGGSAEDCGAGGVEADVEDIV
jgi:hypothetical protein